LPSDDFKAAAAFRSKWKCCFTFTKVKQSDYISFSLLSFQYLPEYSILKIDDFFKVFKNGQYSSPEKYS